jgi:hypothetical protein
MSRTLTAADRSALIRLASTLPAGSEERRAILTGLKEAARRTPITMQELRDLDDGGTLLLEKRDWNGPTLDSFKLKGRGAERAWKELSRLRSPVYDPATGNVYDSRGRNNYRVRNATGTPKRAQGGGR